MLESDSQKIHICHWNFRWFRDETFLPLFCHSPRAVVSLSHEQATATANGSFENLRRGGYVYVDKTAYLHSLVRQEGNMFFLSRPRRFGKTLTVSTLEAVFQGKRELFKGLAIDALDYDWKPYPIIHIDFGDCPFDTPKELEGNFAGYIEQGVKGTGMGREAYLAKVREMYDGYRFAPGCETVYNPVSVGSFFDGSDGGEVRFNDYWIETGSSKLVMDMAQSVDLDVTELSQAKGDMDKVQAFLLQTGYLTMDGYDEELGVYYLRFPNKEVQEAYYRNLLTRWCSRESGVVIRNLVVALRKGDTQGYMGTLAAVFASVPYRAGKKEPDFAQVVDVVTLLCGKAVRVVAEDQTSEGRIDLSIVAGEHVYVMEFKADKSAETALRQIKEKRYADKFRLEKGKTIHLLGIAFSSTGHTVQDWKEEVLA